MAWILCAAEGDGARRAAADAAVAGDGRDGERHCPQRRRSGLRPDIRRICPCVRRFSGEPDAKPRMDAGPQMPDSWAWSAADTAI